MFVCVCWVCVFEGFVGARRGEPSREEGRKPQSSLILGCVSPPAFSCLCAPRRRWRRRRALLAGDAALELGAAADPSAEASCAHWS